MSNNYDFSFSDDTINTSDINTESLFDGNTSDSLFGGSVNIDTDEIPSDTFSLEFSGENSADNSQTFNVISESDRYTETTLSEGSSDYMEGLTDTYQSGGSTSNIEALTNLIKQKTRELEQQNQTELVRKYGGGRRRRY